MKFGVSSTLFGFDLSRENSNGLHLSVLSVGMDGVLLLISLHSSAHCRILRTEPGGVATSVLVA